MNKDNTILLANPKFNGYIILLIKNRKTLN